MSSTNIMMELIGLRSREKYGPNVKTVALYSDESLDLFIKEIKEYLGDRIVKANSEVLVLNNSMSDTYRALIVFKPKEKDDE